MKHNKKYLSIIALVQVICLGHGTAEAGFFHWTSKLERAEKAVAKAKSHVDSKKEEAIVQERKKELKSLHQIGKNVVSATADVRKVGGKLYKVEYFQNQHQINGESPVSRAGIRTATKIMSLESRLSVFQNALDHNMTNLHTKRTEVELHAQERTYSQTPQLTKAEKALHMAQVKHDNILAEELAKKEQKQKEKELKELKLAQKTLEKRALVAIKADEAVSKKQEKLDEEVSKLIKKMSVVETNESPIHIPVTSKKIEALQVQIKKNETKAQKLQARFNEAKSVIDSLAWSQKRETAKSRIGLPTLYLVKKGEKAVFFRNVSLGSGATPVAKSAEEIIEEVRLENISNLVDEYLRQNESDGNSETAVSDKQLIHKKGAVAIASTKQVVKSSSSASAH